MDLRGSGARERGESESESEIGTKVLWKMREGHSEGSWSVEEVLEAVVVAVSSEGGKPMEREDEKLGLCERYEGV